MRSFRCALGLMFTFALTQARAADPDDLLHQAVREQAAAGAPDAAPQAAALAGRAAELEARREFADAIALLERAYRLDPANELVYTRLLVCKRAAGRLADDEREALGVLEAREMQDVQRALADVRLNLIQARQAIRARQPDVARLKTDAAAKRIAALPSGVDASAYRRELQTARRAVAAQLLEQRRASQPAPTTPPAAAMPPAAPATSEAGGLAPQDAVTLSDAGAAAPPAPDVQAGDQPAGRLLDAADAVADEVRDRTFRAEDAATRRNRVQEFYELMQSQKPPPADLTYPADWTARTQRRARHRDGVIWQGQPFKGPDGQEYYTAIYDLAELAHPVPNFVPTVTGDTLRDHNAQLDRQYLRWNSWIFRGDVYDLSAGLPILPYFGGVDPWAVTPQYDVREVQRIQRLLEMQLKR